MVFACCAAISAGLLAATLQLRQHQNAAALIFSQPALGALPVVPDHLRWGFAIDEFSLESSELRSGDVLGEILIKKGLSYPQVAHLVDNCKDKFNISSMRM